MSFIGGIMTALIDGDSILYKAGFALEEELEDGTFYVDLQSAKDYIDGIIESIMFETDADDYELWVGEKGANFRYKIAEDNLANGYKHNRKEARKPDKFKEMLDYVKKEHKAKQAVGCENDDVVVTKKTESPSKYILCCVDKDVLYQTQGTHWNYGKQEWVSVTRAESIWYAYYQTLVGDTTDGYKGAFRIGPVKAKKILGEPEDFSERTLWAKVLLTYRKCKQTKEEALATMRLANMHQLKRNTQGKLRLDLWEPPTKEEDKLRGYTLPF